MVQFPSEFEFNREYLLFIAKNYSVNIFGTFFFDNEKERREKHAKDNTASIWTYLLGIKSNKEKYLNLLYDKDNCAKILKPNCGYYKYRLWTDYFMRNNLYAQ